MFWCIYVYYNEQVSSDWTPLRWPSEWTHPSALDLVRNSPVNCVLIERNSPLNSEMRKLGLATLDASAPPPGISLIKGEWPGIRAGQGRNSAAGPTGIPWVDSNGWQIRLARAREPRKPVWIETEFPKEKRVFNTAAYLRAMADAAMHGGRWVIHVAEPGELGKLVPAERFFLAHQDWGNSEPVAIVGILSDFAGPNEFAAGELLNLTARLHQPYRVLLQDSSFDRPEIDHLRDAEPPKVDLRSRLETFVQAGGLLVTANPNHNIRNQGKGRVAVQDLSDPYEAANRAQVLLSHRHDLVRFWNGGSLGSYLTRTPQGAVLQIVNYSGRPGADPVSVRVAGPYREARIHLLEENAPKPLPSVPSKPGAIELHLPAIPVYAAIELT